MDPFILDRLRFSISLALRLDDGPVIRFAPWVRQQAYPSLYPGVDLIDVCTITFRASVQTDDVRSFAETMGARLPSLRELVAYGRIRHTRIGVAPIVAIGPLFEKSSALFLRRTHRDLHCSAAWGKPYWSPDCQFLLLAPV